MECCLIALPGLFPTTRHPIVNHDDGTDDSNQALLLETDVGQAPSCFLCGRPQCPTTLAFTVEFPFRLFSFMEGCENTTN